VSKGPSVKPWNFKVSAGHPDISQTFGPLRKLTLALRDTQGTTTQDAGHRGDKLCLHPRFFGSTEKQHRENEGLENGGDIRRLEPTYFLPLVRGGSDSYSNKKS